MKRFYGRSYRDKIMLPNYRYLYRMSGIIQLLPDHVSNQIAAGEVVQRPASAVKELMENAVDAGATRIQVIVKDAGKTLVQVTDNGNGMNDADARLCFERHATSKIKKAEDLFRIHTKGFRGEALASIAAVAQVDLVTRRKQDETGVHLVVEASKIVTHEPVAVAPGSTFQMKNLFFNIPARRNFLKSDAAELKHIIEEFQRVALVHPEIEFTLTGNQDEIFFLPAGNLRQRIVNLLGKTYNEKLVPVETESPIVKIKGFIIKPQFARRSRGEQYFFVNHRFIRNQYLHHAVQSAFQNLLGADQYAGYFLYLEVPTDKIDVNIHPSKIEVKFEEEKAVYTMLNAAVRQSLGRFNIAPSIDFTVDHSISIEPVTSRFHPVKVPTITVDPDYNPFDKEKSSVQPVHSGKISGWDALKSFYPDEEKHPEEKSATLLFPVENTPHSGLVKLFGPYYLINYETCCLVLHSRRAWECIHYYRLIQKAQDGAAQSQQLLFPERVRISDTDIPLWQAAIPALEQMGFSIQYEGEKCWKIYGIPAGLEEGHPVTDLINEVTDALREAGEVDAQAIRETIIARLAYRFSLSAMRGEQSDELADALFSTPSPSHTPGGLLTFICLTREELDQKFKK